MNKTELVEAIVKNSKDSDVASKAQVARIVDTLLDTVKETVGKGEDVALVGFGTFTSVKHATRKGHNPQTGKSIEIAERVAPKFKPGKAFKEAVAAKPAKKAKKK